MARAPIDRRTPATSPIDQLATSLTTAPAKKAPAKKAPSRSAPTASRSRTTNAAPSGDMTLDSFLSGLRQHESGNNYTARSSSSSASGAYQYIDSTWNHYGGYAHAWQAPPAVQDARARADVQANYKKYGGDWRKVAAAHFAGSGWVDRHPDPNTWNQNPVPGSNNPTVAQYVAAVFHNAGMATNSGGQALPSGGGKGTTAPAIGGGATATAATGGVTVAGTSTALPATATPQQVKDRVARDYGYLAAFLNIPEVGNILKRAALEDWDETTLTGALTKTNWWKTTSATSRQWDALNLTDHATARSQVDQQIAAIQAQATKTGLVLAPIRVHDMAVNSLRFGWNTQQLTDAILHEGKLDLSGSKPNDALSIKGTLKQRAAQYLVPMADAALDKWTLDVVSGKVTQDSFDAYLKEQAKSLFPSMSAAIDSGVTVAQYVDPYKQIAADTLEVPVESINFNDPKWSKALFQTDPKSGQRTSMSLAQWQQTLRTDPTYGYSKTAQANDVAARLTESLLQTFGKVAS